MANAKQLVIHGTTNNEGFMVIFSDTFVMKGQPKDAPETFGPVHDVRGRSYRFARVLDKSEFKVHPAASRGDRQYEIEVPRGLITSAIFEGREGNQDTRIHFERTGKDEWSVAVTLTERGTLGKPFIDLFPYLVLKQPQLLNT